MLQFRAKPMSFGPAILTHSPLVSGEVGTAYVKQIQGSGGQPPYTFSLASGSLPTGLSLSPSGVISGTPGATFSGTLGIRLTDNAGGVATAQFLLTIVAAVQITTVSPLTNAALGVAYTFQMAGANGVTPYVWSLTSQTGSNGWSVSPSGQVTGAPGMAETDTLTIQVIDALGGVASGNFAITTSAALTITTPSPLPNATQSSAYSTTLSASGGTPPYTWSLTSATGANSWAVSPSGIVTGTPGNIETDVLNIKVVDSVATPSAKSFNLSVTAAVAGIALGSNIAQANYYSGSTQYLNLLKQASPGGATANNNTRWGTESSSNANTGEESYLQLDANGYATSLTASPTPPGGQVFTHLTTVMILSRVLGQGCTTTYPPGTYRLKFIGLGTIVIAGDASLTLTNTSAETYVSGTFTVTTTSLLTLSVTAINSATDYPRDMSVVPSAYTTQFDAGASFHPYFLAQVANLTSFRFMQSSGVYSCYTPFQPQSYPITAGSTSIVLGNGSGTSAPWTLPTQTRKLYIIDGEIFNATFTLGSATVQLNGTLQNAIPSTTYNTQNFFCAMVVSWVDTFSQRTLPSAISWAPDNYHTMPLEVQIALCNQQNTDFYLNIPPTVTLADAVSTIQAVINGTGLQAGWTPLNSNLKVRVEYANETWTETEFEQLWMTIFGQNQWPTQSGATPNGWARNWYGYWLIQIANAMQTSLGTSVFDARVVIVIGAQGQAPNSTSVTGALWNTNSYWSGSAASNEIVDAIAIADYWPLSYSGWISPADATTLITNGLADFFLLAQTNTPPTASGGSGYTYTSVHTNGYLGYTQSFYSTWTALSATYDIIGYEGSPSFIASDDNGATGGGTGVVTGWGAFVMSAMRDPRMQTLYTSYLNGWPFGKTQANVRHIFQDLQSPPASLVTGTSANALTTSLVESTMQMNGSTPLATGQYYKWAAVQAYLGHPDP